jgi:porphobilinogen synthase
LTAEATLAPEHLIYPLFITDEEHKDELISTMPGQSRLSRDGLLRVAESCTKKGIGCLALFPVISPLGKSLDASEAFNPEGLVPRRVRLLKEKFPNLGVMTDIALDPYTSHGQDGLIDSSGYVLNDETIAVLVKQAICHSQAGADIVAPSDMMDGRIGAIRLALDRHHLITTQIVSYAAKYASSFYGPFRDAVGSQAALGQGDKKTYQMNPANSDEALREIAFDLQEGADMIMVKPGIPYLDIVRRARDTFGVPTLVYHVSGEYAMLKAAAQLGYINEPRVVLETLLCCRRAGAHGILTYYALEAASWLLSNH